MTVGLGPARASLPVSRLSAVTGTNGQSPGRSWTPAKRRVSDSIRVCKPQCRSLSSESIMRPVISLLAAFNFKLKFKGPEEVASHRQAQQPPPRPL
jgi:hypothetical protein